MKRSVLALCLVCLPLGGLALGADASSSTQQERIDQLEQELRDVGARLNQTIEALHRQADGARELEHVLELSEDHGFTYGINPRSRELLLSGLRDFISGLQRDLPRPSEQPAEAKPRKRVH